MKYLMFLFPPFHCIKEVSNDIAKNIWLELDSINPLNKYHRRGGETNRLST